MAAGYPVKADYANGDVLTATNLNDLAGTVNLAVNATPTTGTQMAGKNKFINGDFGVWQRGTSFTGALNNVFCADRWNAVVSTSVSGLSWTVSQQTFTPGSAPIAGYEGTFFLRADISTIGSATLPTIRQKIEDVRTFANQIVTASWWGRSSTTTTVTSGFRVIQNFGSGGSTAVDVTASNVVYTSSWQRFTRTFTMNSVSGKTIGAGNSVEMRLLLDGVNGANLDIWGVQLEAGSTATAFQTATGSVQGELAACQRYYYRQTYATGDRTGVGFNANTSLAYIVFPFPVTMRTAPTALEQSGTGTDYSVNTTTGNVTCSAVPTFFTGNPQAGAVNLIFAASLPASVPSIFRAATANAYFGWSAEL
jgi:hypothetical protein